MNEILKPQNNQQLIDIIKWAISEGNPLSVQGLGTKSRLGRLCNNEYILDMSEICGIHMYEPDELVLTAASGTPIDEIKKILADKNQELEFEPANYTKLLGNNDIIDDNIVKTGTIGGMIATNASGPRRIKVGAARDHFLGFKAISGRGEEFKSGGRVVKNVTGYDLSKIMAGSWGTLGVMSEITIKTMPKPETTRTILLLGAEPEQATKAMTQAFNSSNEISAAAWISEEIAVKSNVEILRLTKGHITAMRIEGEKKSVAYRCKKLRDMMNKMGKVEELHQDNSNIFWRDIRNVQPFSARGDNRVVWRVSCAPQDGWKVINKLKHLKSMQSYMDWGGGLVWIAIDAPKVGAERLVRDIVNSYGGHAMLMRSSEKLRQNINIFHPPQSGLMKLTKKLKNNFDPHAILNPGRMYKGV